jgi:hypothetical protein
MAPNPPKKLDKMTKVELHDHLKSIGKKCTGKNKADLLRLALVYNKSPESDISQVRFSTKYDEKNLEDERKIFVATSNVWSDISRIGDGAIPSGFGHLILNSYLTEIMYKLDGDAQPISSGTLKPAVKGRHLYLSSKIQMCETFLTAYGLLLFRAMMDASMKKELQ